MTVNMGSPYETVNPAVDLDAKIDSYKRTVKDLRTKVNDLMKGLRQIEDAVPFSEVWQLRQESRILWKHFKLPPFD